MATITGTSLEFLSAVRNSDDPATRLNGAQSITSIEVGGVTYVYVGSQVDDAIQVFTMDGAGTLTPVAAIADTGGITLNGMWEIEAFEVDGVPYLAAAGEFDDGLTLFSISGSAPYLTFADRVLDSDNADLRLNGPVGLSVAQLSSGTYVYVSSFNDDGISGFRVGSGGSLVNVDNVENDNTTWFLDGALSNFTFRQGGSDLLVAMSGNSDNVTIASINQTTGALTPLDTISGGGINRPWGGSAKVIDGAGYLYIGSDFGDAIVVLRWDGVQLEEVQVISSASLLDGARLTSVIEVGGRTLLYAQSGNSDTALLFEIDTDPLSPGKGTLTPLETLSGGSGVGLLNNVQEGHAVEIGGQQFLLVAANLDDAVNVYEIGGGDDVLEGTREADDVSGGGGDDVIFGFDGDDAIDGGAGDDIIYGGSGDDFITISSGSDNTFGGSGIDTIFAGDLVGSGLLIDLLRNDIVLPDGTVQFISGFEVAIGSAGNDTIVGTDGANVLAGADGNDTLRGRDGGDEIFGNGGNDRLFGAGGDDLIDGDIGNDLLQGGSGDDVLNGGEGDDRFFGGSGVDVINAGSGDDQVKANEGNDLVRGGGGNDILEGQQGDDDLRGDGGNDVLIGGGGRDRLDGGSGNDELTGGSAIDTFVFTTVAKGGGGINRITDFQDGLDLVNLSGYAFSGFGDVAPLIFAAGPDARIVFGDGQVVRFENTAAGDLDASDFIF